QIHDNCTLLANSEKGITLDDGARMKHGVYLDTEVAATGYIRIGKRVYIGAGCCLHGHEGLEIGDDSLLAQNITITPYSHSFDNPEKTVYSQGGIQKKIVIGRDCYLGMNVCVVCTAENIGEGSVVGAGSVVVRSIPPYAIAVGVPAKVFRYRGQIKGKLK
ncbi:MAG: acyltransferase, partial [Kiritimatiellia bacterium]|nr:acyltransferase [Kiritimatiellia bacterium]